MNYTEIRRAVLRGDLDTNLVHLASDVRARQEVVAHRAGRTLRPGAAVTVSGLKPAYINGQSATIVQVNRTRAVIRFNDPATAGRFADQEVTVPLANIELVTEGASGAAGPTTSPANPRMREGAPVHIPDLAFNFEFDYKAKAKWFDEYTKDKQIIRFPVADNYAFYEVRGNTLHHIPIGDAYQAHPALLRGLTRTEVDDMLERDRRMAELFKQRGTA